MNAIDSVLSEPIVYSALGLFLINALILVVFLLLKQRSKMEAELLRMEDKIEAMAESSYAVKKRVIEAEKRICSRINQLKQTGPTVATPISTPPCEEEPLPKENESSSYESHQTKVSSKAEADILAVLSAMH